MHFLLLSPLVKGRNRRKWGHEKMSHTLRRRVDSKSNVVWFVDIGFQCVQSHYTTAKCNNLRQTFQNKMKSKIRPSLTVKGIKNTTLHWPTFNLVNPNWNGTEKNVFPIHILTHTNQFVHLNNWTKKSKKKKHFSAILIVSFPNVSCIFRPW